MQIELITITRGKKLYGAGLVTVTIGNAPMDGIALRAGAEKHITTVEYAHDWLTERGLDGDDALTLINAAQGDQAALKLLS